jgi:biotin transporter BioY
MMTQQFHKFWLKITAIVIGSFGPIFFLGTMIPTAEPARFTLDLLSFPIDGVQNYNEPTTRFLSALTGGFLFGWGVMVWCLSVWVYDKAPEAVRKTVLIGVLSWFIIDSLGSITSGNPSNSIFNIIVLLVTVGPLWQSAKPSIKFSNHEK